MKVMELSRKTILVTDDDPGVQDIYKIILEKAGYNVVVHDSGKAIMENDFDNPNIFLLDKQLSGIDGIDVCRHLKSQEQTKDIPIIMMSASPGLATSAKNAGADDFLEKPFQLKDLLAMITKYIH